MTFRARTDYRHAITSDEKLQPWHAHYRTTNGYRKHGSLWVGPTVSLPAEELQSIWHIPRVGDRVRLVREVGEVAATETD